MSRPTKDPDELDQFSSHRLGTAGIRHVLESGGGFDRYLKQVGTYFVL